jgi:hypothetical protein
MGAARNRHGVSARYAQGEEEKNRNSGQFSTIVNRSIILFPEPRRVPMVIGFSFVDLRSKC